jgi:hypothetical protein
MLTKEATIVAGKDQICSELGGEAVILQLNTGVYYGLNEVGASIWKLIQESKTIDEIRNSIVEEYEVSLEECDRDLLALLEQFKAEGLIEVRK